MKILKLLLRFAIIGSLILLILISLLFIRGVVSDREHYRSEAITKVSQGMAGEQRLVGPLRIIPWKETQLVERRNSRGELERETVTKEGVFIQTPNDLDVSGELVPQIRRIGLFDVSVYEWQANLKASFDSLDLSTKDGRIYTEPYLVLGLEDVRGLIGKPNVLIDQQEVRLSPGTRDLSPGLSGMHTILAVNNPKQELVKPSRAAITNLNAQQQKELLEEAPKPLTTGEYTSGQLASSTIDATFVLSGTQSLAVVPVADNNHVSIESTWPHPYFSGSFLPRERNITDAGFNAQWEIPSLATQVQSALSNAVEHNESYAWKSLQSLEISLVNRVDVYTQADRATKYGILFVMLTFVGFILLEVIKQLRIHPIQYLLVGLALAIFFLLLLSLSEHIDFWIAYLISAVACIGLQFVYLIGVLQSKARAGGFALMLTLLYGALYGLLVSEYNALLMGSLLLFAILAGIMWITRKLDWYKVTDSLR